jgi:hypothetical protein
VSQPSRTRLLFFSLTAVDAQVAVLGDAIQRFQEFERIANALCQSVAADAWRVTSIAPTTLGRRRHAGAAVITKLPCAVVVDGVSMFMDGRSMHTQHALRHISVESICIMGKSIDMCNVLAQFRPKDDDYPHNEDDDEDHDALCDVRVDWWARIRDVLVDAHATCTVASLRAQ